jgi:hypothetical protein
MRFWWAFAVLLPTMSWAQLTGSWVIQPELTKFEVFRAPTLISPLMSLDRGVYRRTDCRGDPIDMPADGGLHPVKKQPFFDQMSVRVVDDRHVAIEQKLGDTTTWKGTYTVSEGGAEMTLEFENDLAAKPVTGALQYLREGTAVAGAHPLTGTWIPEKLLRLSPSGSALTFTVEPGGGWQDVGKSFTLAGSDGRSAEGKVDAQDYPLQGYLPGATISLNRLQPNVWKMNRKQNQTLVEMLSARLSDDARTMTLRQGDLLCGVTTTFTLVKQVPPQP